MNRKATSILLRGAFAALLISAVFAGSAAAAPVWKFNGETLTGKEKVVGAAEDSTMVFAEMTTDCQNFLYEITIENVSGTGKGSVTELPLFECATDLEVCTVASIGAEKLPWSATLTKISTTNYIIIEGIKVGIEYGGEECAFGGLLIPVSGKAGGSIDNTSESATFNSSTFSATSTKLTALEEEVKWTGVFPTEAFEWLREQALSVG